MNCPKCNKPVADGAAFCGECGAGVADFHVASCLVPKTTIKIKEKFSSGYFLACAIFLSIIAVILGFNAVSSITSGDIFSAFVPAVTSVCTLVSAVSAWLMFALKKASAASIRAYNAYNVVMTILATVTCIFAGLGSFIIFIVCVIGGVLIAVLGNVASGVVEKVMEMFEGSIDFSINEVLEFLTDGGVFVAICGAIAVALIMFLSINGVLLYKNNAKYVKEIAIALKNDKYETKRYPKVRPWAFGVVFAAFGVATMMFDVVTALALIADGGMLIVSVLWFKTIHTEDYSADIEITSEKPAVVETPVVEAPTVEMPVVEAPEVEAPVVEEPEVEVVKEAPVEEKAEDAEAAESVETVEETAEEPTEAESEVAPTEESTETETEAEAEVEAEEAVEAVAETEESTEEVAEAEVEAETEPEPETQN